MQRCTGVSWEFRRGLGVGGPSQRPLEHAVAKPRTSGHLGKFRSRGMLVLVSEGSPPCLALVLTQPGALSLIINCLS